MCDAQLCYQAPGQCQLSDLVQIFAWLIRHIQPRSGTNPSLSNIPGLGRVVITDQGERRPKYHIEQWDVRMGLTWQVSGSNNHHHCTTGPSFISSQAESRVWWEHNISTSQLRSDTASRQESNNPGHDVFILPRERREESFSLGQWEGWVKSGVLTRTADRRSPGQWWWETLNTAGWLRLISR